jgi:hypothetical protein
VIDPESTPLLREVALREINLGSILYKVATPYGPVCSTVHMPDAALHLVRIMDRAPAEPKRCPYCGGTAHRMHLFREREVCAGCGAFWGA